MAGINDILARYKPALDRVLQRTGLDFGTAPSSPPDLSFMSQQVQGTMSQPIPDLINGIIKREGGYANHPLDRGGPTKYGITQDTLSGWLGRPATEEDVKNLDTETAYKIYETRYVGDPGFSDLPDPIRSNAVDFGVMAGPDDGVNILQKGLRTLGYYDGKIDGRIGPKTRAAVQRAEKDGKLNALNNLMVDERIAHHHRDIEKNPKQAVFAKNWIKRANGFRV